MAAAVQHRCRKVVARGDAHNGPILTSVTRAPGWGYGHECQNHDITAAAAGVGVARDRAGGRLGWGGRRLEYSRGFDALGELELKKRHHQPRKE